MCTRKGIGQHFTPSKISSGLWSTRGALVPFDRQLWRLTGVKERKLPNFHPGWSRMTCIQLDPFGSVSRSGLTCVQLDPHGSVSRSGLTCVQLDPHGCVSRSGLTCVQLDPHGTVSRSGLTCVQLDPHGSVKVRTDLCSA